MIVHVCECYALAGGPAHADTSTNSTKWCLCSLNTLPHWPRALVHILCMCIYNSMCMGFRAHNRFALNYYVRCGCPAASARVCANNTLFAYTRARKRLGFARFMDSHGARTFNTETHSQSDYTASSTKSVRKAIKSQNPPTHTHTHTCWSLTYTHADTGVRSGTVGTGRAL